METNAHAIGETGHRKNCDQWALYEEPRSSPTANLCHGGFYGNEWHGPCASMTDCRLHTIRKKNQETNQRPFTTRGSTVVASTQRPPSATNPWHPNREIPATSPQAIGNSTALAKYQELRSKTATTPPDTVPYVMRTPYVTPVASHGEMTPTFLPMEGEGIIQRLFKNMAQGAVGSAGWHVYDLARSTDWFTPKRPPQRPNR
jgi:hypothetical protein